MKRPKVSIRCKNDSMLALANLDGIPLCEHCILDVSNECDNSCLHNRITPLDLRSQVSTITLQISTAGNH